VLVNTEADKTILHSPVKMLSYSE